MEYSNSKVSSYAFMSMTENKNNQVIFYCLHRFLESDSKKNNVLSR